MSDNIFFFIPDMNGGGAERALLNILKYWPSQSILKPILVVRKLDGPYVVDIPKNINVEALETDRSGLRASLYTIIRLAHLLRRYRPSAVVSFLSAPSVFFAIKFSRINCRLIISLQNPIQKLSTDPDFSFIIRKSADSIIRSIYRNSSGIIPIAPGIAHEIISQFNLNTNLVRVVPNSADLTLIREKSSQKTHIKLDLPHEIPVIVSAGRLVYQKGMDLLIDAIGKINQKRECRLVILGKGKEHDKLQAQINKLSLQDKVTLAGFCENPWSIISKATIFVLSSRYEGFGNVLIEALACGVPVLSTRAPYGPEYILDNGLYGSLVEPNNSDALAKGIDELLSDKPRLSRMSELGKLRAMEFDAPAISNQFYNTVIMLNK